MFQEFPKTNEIPGRRRHHEPRLITIPDPES